MIKKNIIFGVCINFANANAVLDIKSACSSISRNIDLQFSDIEGGRGEERFETIASMQQENLRSYALSLDVKHFGSDIVPQ